MKKNLIQKFKNFLGYTLQNNNGEIINEPFLGAWQQNISAVPKKSDRNFAYFSCLTISSNSIGNLPPILQKKEETWQNVDNRKYKWILDLLEKPNPNQYSIDFFTRWVLCLQQTGNVYILKKRGQDQKIKELYIMNPKFTVIKVAENGEVYYQFNPSDLAKIKETITVPASEVIHHKINCLFSDLIGISPLHAALIHASNSLEMSGTLYDFYKNMAQPSGILVAPEAIDQNEALRIKNDFENNRHKRHGSVVVMGDGMTYQSISMSAQDQQLLEILKFNSEAICACFHIPSYKIMGNAPTYNNVEALNLEYYNNALQFIVNGIEHHLTYGLELGEFHENENLWVKLDTKELLQMDQNTRGTFYNNAIKGGWMTPNEARISEDLLPIEGGDTVYLQQQNYSIQALNERDKLNPLALQLNSTSNSSTQKTEEDLQKTEDKEDLTDEQVKKILEYIQKGLK